MVWHAIETTSEVEVAVKKLRTSQKIKRPILQYEAKIMQLLQGNPSIPILYGYGHLPHFEYISMELLGPNLKEVCPQLSGIKLATVVEFTKQAVRYSISHQNSHLFGHRAYINRMLIIDLHSCRLYNTYTPMGLSIGISKSKTFCVHEMTPHKSNLVISG
jgi:casein kinase 1 delta